MARPHCRVKRLSFAFVCRQWLVAGADERTLRAAFLYSSTRSTPSFMVGRDRSAFRACHHCAAFRCCEHARLYPLPACIRCSPAGNVPALRACTAFPHHHHRVPHAHLPPPTPVYLLHRWRGHAALPAPAGFCLPAYLPLPPLPLHPTTRSLWRCCRDACFHLPTSPCAIFPAFSKTSVAANISPLTCPACGMPPHHTIPAHTTRCGAHRLRNAQPPQHRTARTYLALATRPHFGGGTSIPPHRIGGRDTRAARRILRQYDQYCGPSSW